MPIEVRQFPCRSDNYGYLVRDQASGSAACIDTPDAAVALRELQASGWRLDLILNTHWHVDHTEGNAAVQAATGAQIVGPAEVRKVAPLDRVVAEGDTVKLGDTTFAVFETPGHTLGHIVYLDAEDDAAFVGDTLFALGCGRLLEGAPAQMWNSLSKLALWPDATKIYCAHEYTADNARFALELAPSPALAVRAEQIFAARKRGEPTVPSLLGVEKATNPFLRAPQLARALGVNSDDPVDAFAAVRAAKDSFKR